jgi:hypothetical protein
MSISKLEYTGDVPGGPTRLLLDHGSSLLERSLKSTRDASWGDSDELEEVDAPAGGPTGGPARGRIFDESAAERGQLRSKSSENRSSLLIREAADGD